MILDGVHCLIDMNVLDDVFSIIAALCRVALDQMKWPWYPTENCCYVKVHSHRMQKS